LLLRGVHALARARQIHFDGLAGPRQPRPPPASAPPASPNCSWSRSARPVGSDY